MNQPPLAVPVVKILSILYRGAKGVSIIRVYATFDILLRPAETFGRQVVRLGHGPLAVELVQFAACTGPAYGPASVGVVVVVVEAVVVAVVLSVGGRQVFGGRVDAVAFGDAEDVTFGVAVGAVVFVPEWVERWVGCCAFCEGVS